MTTLQQAAPALRQRLRRLWDQFHALLEAGAISGDLGQAIEGALNVDRSSSAVQNYLSELVAEGAKQLETMPNLALGENQEMTGAAGAYVGDLNLILINSTWLADASDAEVIKVMAEEYGHSLDAQFNSVDTPGDEGEQFAALLLGYEAPAESAFEDDAITVSVNGVIYAAEAATASLSVAGAYRNTADGTTISPVNDNISIAHSGTVPSTIYSGGGIDRIFLTGATTRLPLIDPGGSVTNTSSGSIAPSIQATVGKEIFIVKGAQSVVQFLPGARSASTTRSVNLNNPSYNQVEALYVDDSSTVGWSLYSGGNAAVRQTIGGGPAADYFYANNGSLGSVIYTNIKSPITAGSQNITVDTTLSAAQGGDVIDLTAGGTQLVFINIAGPVEATLSTITTAVSPLAAAASESTSGDSASVFLSTSDNPASPVKLNYKANTTTIPISNNSHIIDLSDFEECNKVRTTLTSIQSVINARDAGVDAGVPWSELAGKRAWIVPLITDLQNGIVKVYFVSQIKGDPAVELLEVKKAAGKAGQNVDLRKVYDQIYLTKNIDPSNPPTPGQTVAPVIPTATASLTPEAIPEDARDVFISSEDFEIRATNLFYDYTYDQGGADLNKPGATLTPTIVNSVTGWNFSPAPDDDSEVIFLAEIGNSYNQLFRLDLTPVNDSPIATFITTQNAIEDGPTISGYLTSTDVDRVPTSTQGDTARYEQVTTVEGLTIVPNAPTLAPSTSPYAYEAQWIFNPAVAAYQYLAKDQTTSRTVTYKVTDSGPLPSTADDLSATNSFTIFITGVNDTPIVSATDVTGIVIELGTASGNLTDSGTLTFTDVDLTDVHSISTVTPSANALGTLNASVTTDTTSTGLGGVVTWYYSVAASAVEYLAKDQTKVETFTFNVLDDKGGSVQRTVTVTITGTNDDPIVSTEDVTGAVTELLTAAGNLTDSGTLTFTDVDLTDVHSIITITPSANALGTLTASVTTDTTGTGTGGVVTWNYSVAASAVEYLAAGQTKVETFTFNVLDGNGGSIERTVSVTITGTNDAPDISIGGGDSAYVALSVPGTNAVLSTSDTLTVVDADLADTVTASVESVSIDASSSYTGSPPSIDSLKGMLTVAPPAPGAISANDGDTNNLSWLFNSGTGAFNFLAAGDTIVLDYTIQATDSNTPGASDTQVVRVIVTNGRPTLTISLGNNLPLTGQNFSTPITFQFSEEVVGFDASDASLTNGVLSNFQAVTGNPTQYTAVFTATNFYDPTGFGTVSVSANYTDLEGNPGYAVSQNLTMTEGGGADPNDGPSGGAQITTNGNTTTGTTNDETITQDNGVDIIYGGTGNDNITSGNAGDSIYAGVGNDTAAGGKGIDFIYGGSGDDTLYGDEIAPGNDSGGDFLVGGFGKDSLTGGGGSDEFRYLSLYDQGDVITDFSGDTIVFDTTGSGTQFAFTALAGKTYTQAIADGTLVFNDTTDILSYDHDGSAGIAWAPIAIVTVTNATSTTLTDLNVLFQDL